MPSRNRFNLGGEFLSWGEKQLEALNLMVVRQTGTTMRLMEEGGLRVWAGVEMWGRWEISDSVTQISLMKDWMWAERCWINSTTQQSFPTTHDVNILSAFLLVRHYISSLQSQCKAHSSCYFYLTRYNKIHSRAIQTSTTENKYCIHLH